MRFITVALTAAVACAAAVPVFAAPTHLTDVQFIAANRCLGLMSSKSLGTPDAAALRLYLKSQEGGRNGYVFDRADEARRDGDRDASRSGAEIVARLTAERDGVCRGFLAATTTASAPGPAHSLQ